MMDFASLTGKFRAHQDSLHESSTSRVTKRPRASLVCNQCKSSKLRCDRGHPCSSCVKRDEAAACCYRRLDGSRDDTSRQAIAEDRLIHLESLVKQLMQTRPSAQNGHNAIAEKSIMSADLPHDSAGDAAQPQWVQIDEPGYVGFTHWSAILDDIHDLQVALGDAADLPHTEESVAPEAQFSHRELIFGSSKDYSLLQIISHHLPSKVELDRCLSFYFQGQVFLVPFIHTIQFQRQYRDFWADPAGVNPLWLSILFSICSMASLMKEAVQTHPAAPNDGFVASETLRAIAGQCLVLGEYHRPQPFALEALCLYAHCRNLKSLDSSREAGAILGIVVRMAYEMGYHRDPDAIGSFSVFEGEMRRRFWSALKQTDLMISFQLGLPSNICLQNCDTKSPRNLLDSDFDVDTSVLPESRPDTEASRLLWIIVKDKQMISFSKVCRDALSFTEKCEAEILQLDQEIRQMQMTVPDVLQPRPLSDSIADPPFLIMVRMYIEFISLKSLFVLHRKYMVRGDDFSTSACVESGQRLVSQFIDMYNEFAPGGQLYTARWMLTNFTMNDFHSSILVLCLYVHTRRKRALRRLPIHPVTESELLPLLEQSHAICVEKSVVSKDARRVGRAVGVVVDGIKSASMSKNTTSAPPQQQMPFAAFPGAPQAVGGADLTSLSLEPQNGTAPESQAPFDLFDNFNFLGNGFEGIDWTTFDSQIAAPLAPYEDVNFTAI